MRSPGAARIPPFRSPTEKCVLISPALLYTSVNILILKFHRMYLQRNVDHCRSIKFPLLCEKIRRPVSPALLQICRCPTPPDMHLAHARNQSGGHTGDRACTLIILRWTAVVYLLCISAICLCFMFAFYVFIFYNMLCCFGIINNNNNLYLLSCYL